MTAPPPDILGKGWFPALAHRKPRKMRGFCASGGWESGRENSLLAQLKARQATILSCIENATTGNSEG